MPVIASPALRRMAANRSSSFGAWASRMAASSFGASSRMDFSALTASSGLPKASSISVAMRQRMATRSSSFGLNWPAITALCRARSRLGGVAAIQTALSSSQTDGEPPPWVMVFS